MVGRSHLSIGEVLSLLHDEFPDVTISKIRFLESQGLVDPERTPSGYRKFYDSDIERLRWVLRQQRDSFLPLKVIKGRLDNRPEPDGDQSDDVTLSGASVVGGASFSGAGLGTAGLSEARMGAASPDAASSDAASPGAASPGAAKLADSDLRPQAGQSDTALEQAPISASARVGQAGTLAGPGQDVGAGHEQDHGQRPPRSQLFDTPPYGNHTAPGEPEERAGLHSTGSEAAGSDRPGSGRPAGEGSAIDTPESEAQGATAAIAAGPARPGASPAHRRPEGPPPTGEDRPSEVAHHAGPAGAGGAGASASGASAGGAGASAGGASAGGAGTGRAGEPGASATGLAGEMGGSHHAQDAAREEMTLEELLVETGADASTVRELEGFALITPRTIGGSTYYTREAATIARLASAFARHGVEARHLRAYKGAAEREAGLVEQVIMPLIRQRNPEARQAAQQTVEELSTLGGELRAVLLRSALADLR